MIADPVRVVVADDHPLFREGIVRAFEGAGVDVLADVGDGDAALTAIEEGEPDVALVDVSMPALDGIDVVREVARLGLPVPVVLLSAFTDDLLVSAAIEAGAAAYVAKTADRQRILDAVLTAAGDPGLWPCALACDRDPAATEPPLLTEQERRLLQLARLHFDESDMAFLLSMEPVAIRHHLEVAAAKLDARTTHEAVRAAIDRGLLR